MKTIQSSRGFLVRKNTLPFEGIDMKKEKYIEILRNLFIRISQPESIRRPRKGSTDHGAQETPEERLAGGTAKGGNIISQQVINFFTHIRDPEILRAIDDRFEEHTRISLLRGDVAAVVGQMEDTTSLVSRILDTIGGTDEDVSTEHLAIFAEIARYKVQFIQSTYAQLAASAFKLGPKPSVSGPRIMSNSQVTQIVPSRSGSLVKTGPNPDDKSINYSSVSLGNKGGVGEGASWNADSREDYLSAHPENMKLDLSYFMKSLAAQVEYFVAKLNMYRWKETSTEDQVSDLYRRYVEHRTSLKIKSQIKSFGQMIDQTEGVMEDWIRQISQLEIDSQHQQSQIDGLKEIITELNQNQEKSRKNILDLQDQLKKQIGPDIIQARREFEKNFASVSQAMKEEVVRAHQDKEVLAVKVTELEAKISVFNLEKLKRESKNQSKEVQAIFQIGAIKESRQMLTDTINAPELAVAKGDGNSKNWLCAIMNHVLNARLALELDQSKARQKVSSNSMKSFVIEALLVKFGSAQATETLLRDLITCIQKFSGEGERFKLFARFLGAEDILTQEMVRRKKVNKYEEFLTQYYYTSHLAVRDYLEFCLLVKGFEYHEDMNTLKPFISFPINKRSHLLKVDTARKIYVAFIINKEQKQLLDPEILEEEFDNLLKEDLYDRLHEKGKEIKTKNVRNEEFYLSVDSLSRILLERRLNQFMSFIQRFLSALTINSAARGEKNLFYDDLQYSCKMVLPAIGEGLIGHIFREIADTPQLQAYSLERMIQSAVPTLVLINEADHPFNLLNLVITSEDNDQRNLLLREAEIQIEAKIKKNTAKKEGSRFAALIEGLSAFNELLAELVRFPVSC